jgi:hypothetical protein
MNLSINILGKRKYITVALLTILFTIIAQFILSPPKASAAYDGGRLIDNGIFLDAASMNASQIQSFLSGKGGALAGKSFVMNCDAAGEQAKQIYLSLGAPCNQSVAASSIIYYTSQVYGVNPRVILSTLQKEQSLITATNPTDRQYAQAMGYACPTSGSCSDSSNFFWQIDNGTWVMRFHYERALGNRNWWYTSSSWTCGTEKAYYKPNLYPNQNVNFYDEDGVYYRTHYMVTAASSSLYCYTPHAYNNPQGLYGLPQFGSTGRYYTGSYNFVKFFELWFGQTTQGTAPSVIYKSANNNSLYAVWAGKKYYIPSWDAMIAWGFHNDPVSTVSDSYLNSLEEGDNLSNIVKTDSPGSSLFLLDDGKRYPIPYDACLKNLDGTTKTTYSWGIDCFNTGVSKTLPEVFISTYTTPDITLPQMIAYQDTVWKLEQGKKRRIVDGLVVDVLGGWGNVRWMKDYNANQAIGKLIMRNGFVVRFSNSGQVYFYDNNRLNPIPDPATIYAWGLQSQPIHDFPASFNSDPLPTGSTLSRIAKNVENGNYYIIDNGYRMALAGSTSDWPLGSSIDVTSGGLSLTPEIPLSNVYKSDYGNLFTVFNKKKYYFATMDDFSALGFNFAAVRRLPAAIEYMSGLDYGGMHLANGRLFKVDTNLNQIYRISNNSSQYVNSINYPGLPYDKLITVDQTTAQRYPISGTYSP